MSTTPSSPLLRMAQTTPTVLWNDSADPRELSEAIGWGAVGATCNPVIALTALKADRATWAARIAEYAAAHPTATEDEIGWAMVKRLSVEAAELLYPAFERYEGVNGRLSIQTDPRLYRDADRLVEQAVEFAALAPNMIVKIPVTSAGAAAFEEATYRGVSINATVSFTVAQAVAVGEAVERGLRRREAEGLDVSTMGPVCTIMVGRMSGGTGVNGIGGTYGAYGALVIANPAAARLHGCELAQLVGSPMTRWIPQRLRDIFTQTLAAVAGQSFEVRRSQPGDRLAVLQAGGGEVPVAVTLSVVQVDGDVLYSLIVSDIREQRRAQRAADASLARLEAVVAGIDDAVRIVDAEGCIVDLNDAFARDHGFASRAACRDALVEHPDILAFAGTDGRRLPHDHTPLARALRGEHIDELPLTVTRRDTGASQTMHLRVFPLHDRKGRPLGAVEIGRRLLSPA